MPSLRDKLNAYHSAPKKAPEKKETSLPSCYVQKWETKLDVSFLEHIKGEDLSFLSKANISDTTLFDMLFLDTENTGLNGGVGTIPFLMGVGYFTQDNFVVEQILMRDYDEEIDALNTLSKHLKTHSLIVTFNGHAFDLPLIENRFLLNRLREKYVVHQHLDLLPIFRSTYKLRFQKYNLTTLEEHILNIKRQDDLPGALVPKRFFDYIKTKEFSLLSPVLDHNKEDIVSLPLLLNKVLSAYKNPLFSPFTKDIYAMGKVFEKKGQVHTAHKLYRALDQTDMSKLSRLTLCDSLKKQKRYDEAQKIYEKMIFDHQQNIYVLIALAKIKEHRYNQYREALALSKKALLLLPASDEKGMIDVQKRILRLMKKIERTDKNGIF